MKAHRIIGALTLLTLGTVGGLSGRPLESRPATDYVVVVGESNAISSLTREDAAKLFLKKVATWQDGREVLPVDQPEGSRVREAFTKDVLKRSVSAVRAYWQQQIFSGRNVPPAERASDADVLAFVKEHPNAIGYVSASTPAIDGTKLLTVGDK